MWADACVKRKEGLSLLKHRILYNFSQTDIIMLGSSMTYNSISYIGE